MANEGIMLIDPNALGEPTNEQYLSELDEEEASSFVRVPSVDYKSMVAADKGKLFGQAFMDSLVQQSCDTPATIALLAGRKYDDTGEGNRAIDIGNKMRSISLAVRKKLSLTPGDMEQANTFGEKLASGVGSGVGSMLGMVLASFAAKTAGGALATVIAGPEAAPAGVAAGSTMGAFASSYLNEKAMLAQKLSGKGYGLDFVDKISDLYASMIAPLDVASFNILGGLLRPAATRAAESSIKKLILSSGKAFAEGVLSEGGTEALQQRIQTEFEVATNIRARDWKSDLVDDAVAFIVGGMLGGSTGLVGQLHTRKTMIDNVTQATDMSRKDVARMVDDFLLEANSNAYDVIGEHFDVSEDVAWIDKAFAKVEGKEGLPVSESNMAEAIPEDIQMYQEAYDSVRVDEKSKSLVTELEKAYMERFNARDAEPAVRDEAARKLMQTKVKYREFIESNPFLKQLSERLDDLQNRWETASPEEKSNIEKQMQETAFRMRNPGELQEVVGAAEEEVNAREIELTKMATKTEPPSGNTSSLEQEAKKYKTAEEFFYNTVGKGEHEVIYHKIGNNNIEIIKNPTSKDISDINKEVRADFPNMARGEPTIRTTYDDQGNKYVFRSDKSTHGDIEPFLRDRFGIEVSQDNWQGKKYLTDIWNKAQGSTEEQFVKATDEYLAAERRVQAYRDLANRLQYGDNLTQAQVRREARANLVRFLDMYKAGKTANETDMKNIQKAFRTILAGKKLSGKAASKMLRSVLSIRSAVQFNEKIGVILNNINQVIKSEKVQQYQDLGFRILKKMTPSQEAGKVSPADQLFAEHLNRLLRGRADLVYQTETASPQQQMVESAVYDLANSGFDDAAAGRSLKVLSDFYKNGLSEYMGFREAQRAKEIEIANNLMENLLKGVPFDKLQAAFDSARQKDKQGLSFKMTPYDTSITSIFDILDAPEKNPLGQGTLGSTFDSNKPYFALNTLRGQAKERLDGRLFEIYGKEAPQFLLDSRNKDFLNVSVLEREINISRTEAMSLWRMAQMPGTFNDLVRQGVDSNWLESFKQGENVQFSKEDYQFMQAARELLDWIAEQSAPVYEKLSHRPFRRVDEYFMTSRFFADSLHETGYTANNSVIDTMLNGDFSKQRPTDVDALKQRTKSDRLFQIPDIFEALGRYSMDMTHFIAYAQYATRMKNIFGNPEIRKVMVDRGAAGYLAVIDEHLNGLINGYRNADRTAMSGVFSILGTYASNQVATPKSFLRQVSGIAASMDLDGAGPLKLMQAILDMPRAISSGELKKLTDTQYMKERFSGSYEMAVLFAQEQKKKGFFKGPLSKKLHDFFTGLPRYGDRFASVMTGWMIYRDRMAKTGNVEQAVADAIRAVDMTQQSLDSGKVPVVHNRTDLLSRLFTVFTRSPVIFLDRYLRTWRGFVAGQVPVKEFIRAMVTYHVWIPVFETLITAGSFKRDETLFNMGLGPLSYHIIVGQAIKAIVAGAVEGWTGGEADLPAYLRGTDNQTLFGSFAREVTKLLKETGKFFSYPDYEYMWDVTKAGAQVAEAAVPIPTGWLAATPQAIYELFQGTPDDILKGAKRLAGWTDARLKD